MKKFTAILLTLAMALSLSACGDNEDTSATSDESVSTSTDAPETVYTLKMTYTLSADEVLPQSAMAMAERVTERTNGGIVFENYPNGELAGDVDALELAAQGANVITFGTPDFLATYVPDIGILDGPFLFESPDQFTKIDTSDWMDEMRSELETKGITNLGMSWYFGARHITYTGDEGVERPEDLAGKTMRSASSATRVGMMEALDTAVTQMNWTDVYSALQQGVCDGCEAPLASLYSAKMYEVCKNITLDAHIQAIWCVNMSTDYFNSMPEEYQQILLEEIANEASTTIENVIADEAVCREMLEAEGVTFYEADYDAFSEATLSVYDSIPEWSDGLYDTVSSIINS